MTRTHVILDGIQDPHLGQELSARWARAGLANRVDVAGQCATLWTNSPDETFTEEDMDRAASIARAFGLEIRDRVGKSFRSDNDLEGLRQWMIYEYKSRLATALVFGLPALALHYFGHHLAAGAGDAKSMLYPWCFELLLVGWTCIAAGWPILWQGFMAMMHFRATADLLTSFIILVAYVPSAIAVIVTPWQNEPWLNLRHGTTPMFYAVVFVIVIALAQRWLVHRVAPRIAGKAMLMIPRFSRLIVAWFILTVMVCLLSDWRAALAVAMVLPPAIGLGAINRLTAGAQTLLPVAAFAVLIMFGPEAFAPEVINYRIEIATAFVLMLTVIMCTGWNTYRED